MPGYLLDLVLMTQYDGSNLGASAVQDILVAQAVDISAFREATLEVRVHDKTITAASGAKLEVLVFPELPSAQDPTSRFIAQTTLASVEVNDSTSSSDTPPLLLLDGLPANAGAFARVYVRATQSNPKAADLKATLSISLSLKS